MCAATDEVRKERDKETKHDTTIELAAILHEVSVRGQGEGERREKTMVAMGQHLLTRPSCCLQL